MCLGRVRRPAASAVTAIAVLTGCGTSEPLDDVPPRRAAAAGVAASAVTAPALDAIRTAVRGRAGAKVRLLALVLSGGGAGSAQYVEPVTDRVVAVQWRSPGPELEQVEVPSVEATSPGRSAFGIDAVRPEGIAAALGAVRDRYGTGARVDSAVLARDPVVGEPLWVIGGEAGGRAFVLRFDPSGRVHR